MQQSFEEVKQQLISEIYRAFDGVTLEDGVGLWEGQGLDSYADDEALLKLRRKDERISWDSVTYQDLCLCNSSPSFFDAKGMRFHLPKLMLLHLFESELDLPCDSPNLLFHLKSGVAGNEYAAAQFALLNRQQLTCVVHFLEFHLQEIIEQHREYEQLYGTAPETYYYNVQYVETAETLDRWKERL